MFGLLDASEQPIAPPFLVGIYISLFDIFNKDIVHTIVCCFVPQYPNCDWPSRALILLVAKFLISGYKLSGGSVILKLVSVNT